MTKRLVSILFCLSLVTAHLITSLRAQRYQKLSTKTASAQITDRTHPNLLFAESAEKYAQKYVSLHTTDINPPLLYRNLVELRCRVKAHPGLTAGEISLKNMDSWRKLWTIAETPLPPHNFDGSFYLLASHASEEPRAARGGSLFMVRKFNEPNNTDVIRFGDRVEIIALYAAGKTQDQKDLGEDNLGLGRAIWFNNTPVEKQYFLNYPHLLVGNHKSGQQVFTIESAQKKSHGMAVHARDVVHLKTAPENKATEPRYLWTYDSSVWPQNSISGDGTLHFMIFAGGAETLVNDVNKLDESTQNQFNIQPAERITTGPNSNEKFGSAPKEGAYTKAFNMSRIFDGSVLVLRDQRGRYLEPEQLSPAEQQTINSELKLPLQQKIMTLRATASSVDDEGAHFRLHLNKDGWIALESVQFGGFLQPFLGTTTEKTELILMPKTFDQPDRFEQHWHFDGDLERAFFQNRIKNQHLAVRSDAKSDGFCYLMPASSRQLSHEKESADDAFKIELVRLAFSLTQQKTSTIDSSGFLTSSKIATQ